MQELLVAEGLDYWDGDKLLMHLDLCGGWHDVHRWLDNGFRSTFSPYLFVASGGCHQNWQVVSGTRFLLVYLVKYTVHSSLVAK